jgi:hypothetical protein
MLSDLFNGTVAGAVVPIAARPAGAHGPWPRARDRAPPLMNMILDRHRIVCR